MLSANQFRQIIFLFVEEFCGVARATECFRMGADRFSHKVVHPWILLLTYLIEKYMHFSDDILYAGFMEL